MENEGTNVEKYTTNHIEISSPKKNYNAQTRLTSSTCEQNATETLRSLNPADFPSLTSAGKVDTQLSRPSSASSLPTTSRVTPAGFTSGTSAATVDTNIPRPSSASGLPTTSRVVPVVSQQWNEPPPLSRSVSAIDRLGVTVTEPASSSSSSLSSGKKSETFYISPIHVLKEGMKHQMN